MVKINKNIIGRMITVGVVVLFVWYLIFHINDFSLLLKINPIFVLLLMFISIAAIAANGIFMQRTISLFGKHINFGESVRVSLISAAGNFFAPAGSGLGFRAIYLKKRHGLSYGEYLSVVLCNYAMVFFVSSVLGLTSLYILREQISASFVALGLFFIALLVISLSTFFIRVRTSDRAIEMYQSRLLRKNMGVLKQISKGWSLILANKILALELALLVVFITGLMAMSTYFTISALGLSMSFASLLLFSILGSLGAFINITPGNLGVKEAVYIATSTVFSLTTPQILSIALVDRATMFIVLFLLWIIYGRNIHSSLAPKLAQ